MIVKGIVSAIYENIQKVEVILPEYDNIVTKPLSLYGGNTNTLKVNDFVLVIMFNDDFNDGLVFSSSTNSKISYREEPNDYGTTAIIG